MRGIVALALLLTACAPAPAPQTNAAGPRFDPSGFDAAALGAADDYPVSSRVGGLEPRDFVGTLSAYDSTWKSDTIPKPPRTSPLASAPEPAIRWELHGEGRTLEDYLAANATTALLIARGDTILIERYRYGRRESARFTSYSMAKTLTAMLMGIAIAEGKIRSIEDAAETYVPELRGTEFGRATLKALLSMSSGVAFTEDYSGRDDMAALVRQTMGRQGPGGPAALRRFAARLAAPDTRFVYSSAETQTLGAAIEAAVGRNLAAYATEKLWAPLGAEADASWLVDGSNMSIAYCCFQATLRDWARLALMLAHDGAWNGMQVVPRDWVRAATRVDPTRPHLAPGTATPFFGYGYQTWIFPPAIGGFALLGVRGQAIFVDPASKLVMIHLGASQDPWDTTESTSLVALWRGVRASLAR